MDELIADAQAPSLLFVVVSDKKTFTFSHLADAFIQSDLQLGST